MNKTEQIGQKYLTLWKLHSNGSRQLKHKKRSKLYRMVEDDKCYGKKQSKQGEYSVRIQMFRSGKSSLKWHLKQKKRRQWGVNHAVMWTKNFPGRGSGRYKGPKAEVYLVCPRKKLRGQYGLSSEQERVMGDGAWESVQPVVDSLRQLWWLGFYPACNEETSEGRQQRKNVISRAFKSHPCGQHIKNRLGWERARWKQGGYVHIFFYNFYFIKNVSQECILNFIMHLL